jgi:hypothetical protein
MDKLETVAVMAATIYAAGRLDQLTTNANEIYGRIAAQAWALYDAVEKESAERYSRR